MRLLAPEQHGRQSGVSLDAAQAQAVAAALAGQGLLVAGAPGTGKTTVLKRVAVEALLRRGSVSTGSGAGFNPGGNATNKVEPVLFLTPTRRSASKLRAEIAAQINRPQVAPIVRTPSAIAFAILKAQASLADAGSSRFAGSLTGSSITPRLISGPEQDRILADILAGHLAGEGSGLDLPPGLQPEVLSMKGFRHELRDLLMRMREHGVTPKQLALLGQKYQRPMWQFGAQLFAEYEAVLALTALSNGRQIDPAGVIADAAAALAGWSSEQAGNDVPFHFETIIVDDYQEATAATATLLGEFQKLGSQLVIAGNPDTATQSFRGATPALVGKTTAPIGSERGAFGLKPMVLPSQWRYAASQGGAELITAIDQICMRIPTIGGPVTRGRTVNMADGSRPQLPDDSNPQMPDDSHPPAAAPSGIQTVKLRGSAQQAAWIAKELRREHFLHQTPWEQMAVICRSGSGLADLRRELLGAGVPIATLGSDVPLHQEPAVMPLLKVLQLVTAPEAVLSDKLNVDTVVELLTSPIGGMDAIGLRRLRQALLKQERSNLSKIESGAAKTVARSSDNLLVAAIVNGESNAELGGLAAGLNRVARVFQAAIAAWVSSPNLSTVLWEIWTATGLANLWRQAALDGGNAGVRADRDLDAVMALFKAAEFFAERNPGAGPIRFIEYLQSQDVPADSVAVAGQQQAVAALTPTGAAGGEWQVVVVAGVQEGAWPDLRLRDSMFGTQALVDLLTGRVIEGAAGGVLPATDFVAARAEVLADETRAFAVAISRAQRRLMVTAIENPDEVPSLYLNLLSDEIPLVEPGLPLDLRGIVATARRSLISGTGTATASEEAKLLGSVKLLAALWAAGVAEANPDNWYGANPLSTDSALWDVNKQKVPVSPSKVEAITNCSLRWAYESSGATKTAGVSQNVGNLIHAIAQQFPAGGHSDMRNELERRWPELDLGEGWLANRERVKAEAMVTRLANYLPNASPAKAVEAGFKLPVEFAEVSGRADRIEEMEPGVYRVVDLKTGATVPTAADTEENSQLKIYQLAVAEGAFTDLPANATAGGAQLLYVSSGQNAALRQQNSLDDSSQTAARELIVTAAKAMAGAEFEATAGAHCRNCALTFACPIQPEGRSIHD